MIPIVFFMLGFACIMKAISTPSPQHTVSTQVQGSLSSPVDLTPHLSEFTRLIRDGHRPSQWLVTEAIAEAFHAGNIELCQAISDNYPSDITIKRRQSKKSATPAPTAELPENNQKYFTLEKVTSPSEAITDDDWRMFVDASTVADPNFNSDNAIGMFRQNKKRLIKLGISEKEVKDDPISQYNAFEKEVQELMNEGIGLIKLHTAMPIDVNGESLPITMSGLIAVMRNAGVQNAAKWIDSPEERKKFPNTTEAFQKANGCF